MKSLYSVCSLAIFLFISCATQQSMYKKAKEVNTIEAYEQFLQKYPNDDYSAEIRAKLVELEYQIAKGTNTLEAYKLFLQKYPESTFSSAAKEEYDYQAASETMAPSKFLGYLAQYPDGKYISHLKDIFEEVLYQDFSKSKSLRKADTYLKVYPKGNYRDQVIELTEEMRYNYAKSNKTKAGFQRYMELYPNGKHKSEILALWEDLAYNEIKDIKIGSPNLPQSEKRYFHLFSEEYIANFPNGKHRRLVEDRIAFMEFCDNQTIGQAEKYFQNFPNGIFYPVIIIDFWTSDKKPKKDIAGREIKKFLGNRYIQHSLDAYLGRMLYLATYILPKAENIPLKNIKIANLYFNYDLTRNLPGASPAMTLNSLIPVKTRVEKPDDFISAFKNLGINIATHKLTDYLVLMDFFDHNVNFTVDDEFGMYRSGSANITCNITIVDTYNHSIIYTRSISGHGAANNYLGHPNFAEHLDETTVNSRMFADLIKNLTKL